MEKDSPSRDIESLRRMAPHKDAWVSSSLNGISNALMLATPVFVGLDSKSVASKFPALHARRIPITIGLGAVFGGVGLYQGMCEARRLKQYREARLDYSERMEKRLETLEALAKHNGWVEKRDAQGAAPEGPTR